MEKLVDRWGAVALYTAFIVLVLWSGARMIDHVLEKEFYQSYLGQWRLAAEVLDAEKGVWPEFNDSNPAQYMEKVVLAMETTTVGVPRSNAGRPYFYRLKTISQPRQDIMLLCASGRIILYGLSESTWLALDTMINQDSEADAGIFSVAPSVDGKTYKGTWEYASGRP